jgi:hypothetical protein
MISDTHSLDFDMSEFVSLGKDGYNVGFVFNASLQEATGDCSRYMSLKNHYQSKMYPCCVHFSLLVFSS